MTRWVHGAGKTKRYYKTIDPFRVIVYVIPESSKWTWILEKLQPVDRPSKMVPPIDQLSEMKYKFWHEDSTYSTSLVSEAKKEANHQLELCLHDYAEQLEEDKQVELEKQFRTW